MFFVKMEAGLMKIVRSVNRSWIYVSYFSLYRPIHPGEMSGGGGKCPLGNCPNTIIAPAVLIFCTDMITLIRSFERIDADSSSRTLHLCMANSSLLCNLRYNYLFGSYPDSSFSQYLPPRLNTKHPPP